MSDKNVENLCAYVRDTILVSCKMRDYLDLSVRTAHELLLSLGETITHEEAKKLIQAPEFKVPYEKLFEIEDDGFYSLKEFIATYPSLSHTTFAELVRYDKDCFNAACKKEGKSYYVNPDAIFHYILKCSKKKEGRKYVRLANKLKKYGYV